MCAIEDAIAESFAFVGTAQAAAEVEYCIVIIQRQYTQILLQFLEPVTNFLGIALMGFSIGLVELIQNCFAIAIAESKRIGL